MKVPSRPQYYRIRRMVEMVREGTARGDLPNSGDFAEEFDVSRRTVARDLDFLRDEEKAPVVYDEASWGYRLTEPSWSLPPVQLSRSEVFAFSIARKLLSGFQGTPLELDMRSLFEKIAESLEGKVTVDPGALTERFTILGAETVKLDPEVWTLVAKLTDRQETMRVRYQKFDGEVKVYTLMPLHLVYHHGNWYVLVGLDPSSCKHFAATRGRENVLTFALSRFREIEGTGEHFEVPEWFDLQKHLDESFGIVRGEKMMKVRLLFKKKIATYIREREYHPSQQIIDRRNGDIELLMETAGWKALVRWILSWQPDVKVLAPKKLRERIETKMRQGLGLADS